MQRPQISYVLASEEKFLVGDRCQALLPISSRRTLRRMCDVAKLHNLEISRAERFRVLASPSPVNPTTGLVIAISAAMMPAAELYAHLTGRRAALAQSCWPLPADCEVVFLSGIEWQSKVADWLEREAELRPDGLGIMLSPVEEAAFELAICYAIAFAGHPDPMPRHLTMVVGDLPLIQKDGQLLRLIGAKATPETVRKVLANPNDLLVLQAHGDGHDAKLSETAVLCAYDRSAPASPPKPHAACQVRRRCHRLGHRDLEDAWRTGRLISTSSLRGRVIALDICSAMPVQSRSIEASASLGAAIVMNGCYGALVAGPEISIMTADATTALIEALSSEPRIGRAVWKINAGKSAKQVGRTLFLFGDPRYGTMNASPMIGPVDG